MRNEKNVLVIAPDADFRRSIAFLLEAEGFEVTHHDAVPFGDPASSPERCAVLDEASVAADDDIWDRLRGVAETFVLLLSKPRALPPHLLVQSVEKPLLGASLVEAVQTAFGLSGGRKPT